MSMKFVIILSLQERASDFVEITPHLTGLTACTVHSGLAANVPVEFGEWGAKDIQSNIESTYISIHPVIPSQWSRKTQRAFWHFCAEVCRWQDDRGHFVTIMHPSHSGFWLSQCSRSLEWRNGLTFSTFKNKGEQQYGEISFLTNLSEGSLNRLESLDEGYGSQKTCDPRFAVLLSSCLVGDPRSDQRQAYLFQDIFEDFEDGTCACDPKGMRKHFQFSLQRKSIRCYRTAQKGSFLTPFGLSLHSVL